LPSLQMPLAFALGGGSTPRLAPRLGRSDGQSQNAVAAGSGRMFFERRACIGRVRRVE